MDLKEKRVILTGASTGIGLALLKLLLNEGAYVLAVSRSIESIDLKHQKLFVKNLDLTEYDAVDMLFDYAFETLGNIDIFIANAGFSYFERIKESDRSHIDAIMKLNVHSVIYSAIKMKTLYHNQPFRFVATLSAMSFVSLPGYALYSATKAGLRGFFDAFSLELKPNQMIQTVFPVATKTEFFNRSQSEHMPWPVQTSEHVAKAMIKGIKKNQKRIYPSKIFKLGIRYFPWFFKFYVQMELSRFNQTMKG